MSPNKKKQIDAIIQLLFDKYKPLHTDIPQCQVNCLVSPGFPILWFGDLDLYFSSASEKAISIGVNPSSREFSKGKRGCFKRFPKIEYSNHLTPPENYCEQLNQYFENEPYSWFEKGDNSVSLYEGYKNRGLIHIDCCSTIGTKPSWGGLSASLKERLRDDNVEVFQRMLRFLDPKKVYLASSKAEQQYIIDACQAVLGKRFNSFADINKYLNINKPSSV